MPVSTLNEADTRSKLIDPALYARGWTEAHLKREETAGAIEIVNGKPKRRAKGRIDYTLRLIVNPDVQPVAVALIEAKAQNLPANHGLQQGRCYAACERFNVPFVFASNGHMFVEYDRFTGKTTPLKPLAEFPTPAELRERYEHGMCFRLDDESAKPLLTRYAGGEATRRYYQDAAIRAVYEKLAGGSKRALLSLATGSGKTFIASHLLRRIADAGQLRKALFLCDRDELRDNAVAELRRAFGTEAAEVTGSNPQKNARVLVASYQTLGIDKDDGTASFLTANFPPDYFSHIVIDECHRSAWGKWSVVLTRNPNAVQVGLTATPRKLPHTEQSAEALADERITADNRAHFGEPVYDYPMGQGMDDGYLAACQLQKGNVNLDDTGITLDDILARHPTNAITGQPVTRDELQELYEKTSYEKRIVLPDRVWAMSCDLFDYLLASGGPEQKTIIFCASDRHCDDVTAALNNLYADWCAARGRQRAEFYAFKCTNASGGNAMIADFRGSRQRYFVATTVDLLSTGVDVPCVRNIVFFRYVESSIAFHQMVGRGTRIDLPSGKLGFTVYDYTNASRLFGTEFLSRVPSEKPKGGGYGPEPPPIPPPIQVEGFDVIVTDAGKFVLTTVDGKAVPVTIEEYKERLAERLVAEVPTLEAFRKQWVRPDERETMLGKLPEGGRSALAVRVLAGMEDCDLYDVLAELGYGLAARTRVQRADAFAYKSADWLAALPPAAAATLRAVAAQFAHGGTDALETPTVLQTPEVRLAGGLAALKAAGSPAELVRETKERMFAA